PRRDRRARRHIPRRPARRRLNRKGTTMTHNPIREVLAEAAQGNVPDDDTLRAAVSRYRSVSDRTAGARQLRIHAKRIAAAASAGLPGEVEKLTEAAVHALAQYGSGAERDSLPPREREDTSRKRGPG